MKSVNQIMSEHGSSASKITVRTFLGTGPDEEEDGVPPQDYVLIEGDTTSLRFLAESILAQVNSDYGCTLNIHPNGAGSDHFSESSTVGIFVHRLPCDLHPGNIVR